MKKNAIVGQSGGPTAVINASLYGVVYEALNREDVFGNVYGMINGIEGFLHDQLMDMKPLDTSGELELIKTTPGSYLGSCRYKLPEDLSDTVYPKLFEKFEKYNIGYFFYIGGNDSMDTVSKLSRYAASINSDIRFMGLPKTIDNDLVLTDHTPGFGSAAKYVASTVREIAIDASVYDNKQSVTIVEIMGRHAGWLTAASALARKFKNDIGKIENLDYNEEQDFYTCRSGKQLKKESIKIKKSKTGYESEKTIYACEDCNNCSYKTSCIKGNNSKTPLEQRTKRLETSKKFNRQRKEDLERIISEEGCLLRINRSIQVEGSFAQVKQDMGFRRFMCRGQNNVLAESILLAMALNINKLHSKIQADCTGKHLFELKKTA